MSEIDIEYNLRDVRLKSGLSKEYMDKVVDWFFDNGYTFQEHSFPSPLETTLREEFNIDEGDHETTIWLTTILMYEDIKRNE